MVLMAEKKGISYGSVNYLPGSKVTAEALMRNRIAAIIVDGQRMRLLTEQTDGPFLILPTDEIRASDEALFANVDFLNENAEAIGIFLDELLIVWRQINKDPDSILGGMRAHGLLADLPESTLDAILRYYRGAVSDGLFSNNGGEGELGSDLELYGVSGPEDAGASKPKPENFWHMDALQASLERLGRQ